MMDCLYVMYDPGTRIAKIGRTSNLRQRVASLRSEGKKHHPDFNGEVIFSQEFDCPFRLGIVEREFTVDNALNLDRAGGHEWFYANGPFSLIRTRHKRPTLADIDLSGLSEDDINSIGINYHQRSTE